MKIQFEDGLPIVSFIFSIKLGKLNKKGGFSVKKYLLMFFLLFSFFTLTGCGDEELEDGEQIEEIEEEDELGDGEVDDE